MEQNRLAVITGASSGIGEVFARKMAERGCDLILTARRDSLLDQLAGQLEQLHGIRVTTIVADLSTSDGIESVAVELKKFNSLHYLINCAGFSTAGHFEKVSWQKHHNMLSVHVTAPTQLIHAALPIMMDNNSGVIINVASIDAFLKGGLYSATKNYLVNFSLLLNNKLKNTKIKVQALCPGLTYSGFHKTQEYEGKDTYSKYPKFAWMTAEQVVDISLNSLMKNKAVVVAGLKNKLFIRLLKWRIVRF